MKPSLLYLTDLHYQANGRDYSEEDIYLSSELSDSFDLVLCQPEAAARFIDDFDLVLFRNTGPVMYFEQAYETFKTQALANGTKVFNELCGKADMLGKQYLIDLTELGYPVIPAVDSRENLAKLPIAERYVAKLKQGADSVGMEFISADQLDAVDLEGRFVQPAIDFKYEVSFVYINQQFQYALYAPNPSERWKLEVYKPSNDDLVFAEKFTEWNEIAFGIQRVDACRTQDGELLLMELEDLNPFLSLNLLPETSRNSFVSNLKAALLEYAKH